MATIVSMPKWGLAMKTGLVVEWLKHPGDAIQQGEPVVEIDRTVVDLMRSEPTLENLRAELARFFANPGLVQQALVEQLYQQRMQPGAQEALASTANAAFEDGQQRIDLRDTLRGLHIPVLVIWGEADAVIPVAHAQGTRRASQSRLEVFADCGHCPHVERADAFNQLVLPFLVT